MNPPTRLTVNAVAFISPTNAPILVHAFRPHPSSLKYEFIAHTALDIIEERAGGGVDCYLGLLHTLEDQAVYGYLTPTRVRIVLALALTDTLVRDADVITIFKSLHTAYAKSLANPFLPLRSTLDPFPISGPDAQNPNASDPSTLLMGNKALKKRVQEIGRALGMED